MIDLFKEVVDGIDVQTKKIHADEHKSDTDSGRSSIHGEVVGIKSNGSAPSKTGTTSQLRVTRCSKDKLKALPKCEQTHSQVIGGYVNEKCREIQANEKSKPLSSGGRLNVISRRDAILKRRNMHRRNTIDIYHFDSNASNRKTDEFGINASKSTNCLDKVGSNSADDFLSRIDQLHFNGSSMPGKNNEPLLLRAISYLYVYLYTL